MLKTSESVKAISGALVEFNKKVSVIPKLDTNPFFKSKYAGLPSILKAIKEPLEQSGLALSQYPTGDNELTTLVSHTESGEFIESTFKMSIGKTDPQGFGSAVTYAKRYAIAAILRLDIDDDDDANEAVGNKPASKPKNKAPADAIPYPSDEINPDDIPF